VVCIIDGIVFLLEFKVGDREYRKSTEDQVMDYALDLKYFHEVSKDRYIIPISIATEAPIKANTLFVMEDKIAAVYCCNKSNVGDEFNHVLFKLHDRQLIMNEWICSRYAPTPTIIEAAQALYRNRLMIYRVMMLALRI